MEIKGRDVAWLGAGVPAIIGWVVYGAAWLIGPRFPELPDPLMCSGYAVGAYYILIFVILGGGSAFW